MILSKLLSSTLFHDTTNDQRSKPMIEGEIPPPATAETLKKYKGFEFKDILHIPISELPPTIQYFLAQAVDENNLGKYETAALAYIQCAAVITPPDLYFSHKLSMMRMPMGSFIPFAVHKDLLDKYERASIVYAKNLLELRESNSNKPSNSK